jgi:cob(I)alamin adenosyltransferase
MKIYTKTGDDGTTGLVGSRTRKDDLRVVSYGEVDECNAVIGLAIAEAGEGELATLLRGLQRDLFALGAQLADPHGKATAGKDKAAVTTARIAELERAIDAAEAGLPPLRAFILPGGSRLGATLHLARTVSRRAERGIVSLSARETIEPLLVVYVNRLSDLLFVLARRENQRAGRAEDLW